MILINLLPHREAARKRRKDLFNVALGAAAMAGGLLAGTVYLYFEAAISQQQSNNFILETEIKKLEGQIKDIATLESEIAALRARQQAVEDLQSDRNLPVHLLSELVAQLPDGVFVTKMTQQDQQVLITGVAQSNERVSELLRNLANNTPWFSKPELIEINAGSTAISAKEQRRTFNFNLKVNLMRASEAEKLAAKQAERAALGASAAGPVASAVATKP
jgi:type IV pilus assembly protein PilN